MPKRFAAYGWQVIPNVDGHDVDAVHRAIAKARRVTDKPSLICCKTVIGKGSPNKANTGGVHGAPLGEAEIAATRAELGWPYPPFEIPEIVRKTRSLVFVRGAVAALLLYEHGIVKPNDLSRVNAAFFTMNGWVSVLFFVFWAADVLL